MGIFTELVTIAGLNTFDGDAVTGLIAVDILTDAIVCTGIDVDAASNQAIPI